MQRQAQDHNPQTTSTCVTTLYKALKGGVWGVGARWAHFVCGQGIRPPAQQHPDHLLVVLPGREDEGRLAQLRMSSSV
jgi:hypothetical protein